MFPRRAFTFPRRCYIRWFRDRTRWYRDDLSSTFFSLAQLNGNNTKMIMINRAIALHSRRWRVRAAMTTTTAYKIISASRKTSLGIMGDSTTTMVHNGDFCARRIRLIYYNVATGGSLFPGRRKQSAQVKHEYGTQQPPLLYIILLSIIIHATMMTIIMIIINVTRSAACRGFFTHLSCTPWRPWWNDIFLYYYNTRVIHRLCLVCLKMLKKVTQKQYYTYSSSEFRFKDTVNFKIIKTSIHMKTEFEAFDLE